MLFNMKYLYGTNKQCLKYIFKVLEENESLCYIEDKDTGWKFTYDKESSKIIASDSKSYEFVFKEANFFISENEDEVKKIAKLYETELFESELNQLNESILKLEYNLSKLNLIKTPDKELKDLKLNDIVIVISEDKVPIEGRVSSRWINLDDKNECFINITCDKLDIYNKTLCKDSTDDYYHVEWDTTYEEHYYYDVFLSKDDYNKWVNNENYNNLSNLLNNKIYRKSYVIKCLKELKSNL